MTQKASRGGDEPALDPRRPSLLTLRVADIGRALEFWHDRLGLPIKLRAEGIVELQADTVVLALLRSEAPAPGDGAMAWEVVDLEAARRALVDRGIPCEDARAPAGVDAAVFGRRVAFRDPDGNRLELVAWD